ARRAVAGQASAADQHNVRAAAIEQPAGDAQTDSAEASRDDRSRAGRQREWTVGRLERPHGSHEPPLAVEHDFRLVALELLDHARPCRAVGDGDRTDMKIRPLEPPRSCRTQHGFRARYAEPSDDDDMARSDAPSPSDEFRNRLVSMTGGVDEIL